MSNGRNTLAIQTIVVSFLAAMRSLASYTGEVDLRTLMAEQARDRALQLLDGVAKNVPFEDDSALDRAIGEARRRIESASLPPD